MAGGKGGSQTVTTAIPKWQEDYVKEAINQAKGLNVPYAPYMGVDVVSQAQGINNNLNNALGAFGMDEVGNLGATPVTQDGLTGYRSYDVYNNNMDRFKEAYPDIFRRIEAQTLEPQMASVGALNPVTGMPITPVQTSSSGGSSSDDNWGASPHTGGSMDWGFGDSGMFANSPTEWDFSMFDPIGDTWDYLTNASPQPPRNTSDEYMSFYGNTNPIDEPTP
jgi:hypothetical protein